MGVLKFLDCLLGETFEAVCSHALFSIPERTLKKKSGGPTILVLQKSFELLSRVDDDSTATTAYARDILSKSCDFGGMSLLRDAVQASCDGDGHELLLFDKIFRE